MEFLVITTTQVPMGTLGATVNGLQAGNAECWHDLAAQGHLLRLWHPARPLTCGARSACSTRGMTTSSGSFSPRRPACLANPRCHNTIRTPQRSSPYWRDINAVQRSEFLIAATVAIPEGTAQRAVVDARAREAKRSRELAEQGRLKRLWSVRGLPGRPPCSRSMGRRRRRRHGRHRRIAADV